MYNNVFTGDDIGIEVWQGGNVVCDGSFSGEFLSNRSVMKWDCSNGGKLEATENGREVKYYPKSDGVQAVVPRIAAQNDWVDCGSTANGATIR
jgi:hypothetical protein